MESLDIKSNSIDRERNPEPFMGIVNLGEVEHLSEDEVHESAASIKNPNQSDSRRLFQVFRPEIIWDPAVPYSEQPNRLEQLGPTPLQFPDHFFEVQGGISLVYWMDAKSNGCLCTINRVDELKRTFQFQPFS